MLMRSLMKFSRSALGNDSSKRYFFLLYTVTFCFTAALVFSWFLFSGRTLIWQDDGWTQHYTALVWYGKYLRNIIRTLLSGHKLILPDYDFAIGEGADIIATMHYYVMGEPINLLSVFVPIDKMYILYNGLVILRLYLAGISFSVLCFETNQKNRLGILAGALCYVFCHWAMRNAARHPYFLTPMITFPMLILGVERILEGRYRKAYLFPITVAVAAACNFYFFFFQVILTIVYFVVRAVDRYGKDLKAIVMAGLRTLIPAMIGVLISGLVFVPIVCVFLSDTRFTTDHIWYLLYPWTYYSKFPSILLTSANSYWLCLGMTVPTIFAVVLLVIRKKENRILRWLLLACFVILLVPAFGQILNGLSYRANRWSFALCLLLCYILTVEWPALLKATGRESGIFFCVLVVYWAACMIFDSSRSMNVFSVLCLAFAAFIILFLPRGRILRRMSREFLLFLLIVANIFVNSFHFYSAQGEKYLFECVEVSRIKEEFLNNEVSALKSVAGGDYLRYSGSGLQLNKNVPQGVSSTNYFWTLTNPYLMGFRKDLNLNNSIPNVFEGYDNRAALLALSASNYYVIPNTDTASVPYGFTQVDTVNALDKRTNRYMEDLMNELGTDQLSEAQKNLIEEQSGSVWQIYKNQNGLPLGYTYDAYFTRDQWGKMTAIERQQSILSAVYLSEASSAGTEVMPSETIDSLPYSAKIDSRDLTYQEGKIVTTAANVKMVLEFNSPENRETYFEICGLEFKGTDRIDLYFGDPEVDPQNLYNKTNWSLLSEKEKTTIRRSHWNYVQPTSVTLRITPRSGKAISLQHLTAEHSYYADKHDYILNLGYNKKPCTGVTLTFPTPGVYSFDSIQIYSVPMEDFSEKIDTLKEDSLENIEFGTDTLRGTVDLDTPKIMCIAIPYSAGWRAEVDGAPVPIMVANGHYIGIDLPAGKHTVALYYGTPFKLVGAASTGLGIMLMGGYLWIARRKRMALCGS